MGIPRATLLAHRNLLHHRPFEAVIIIVNKKQTQIHTKRNKCPSHRFLLAQFLRSALCTLVSVYLLGFLRTKAS